jgi:hypothetical protein
MAKSEDQKAEEILEKRRAAAKGLKPQNRPADPMESDPLEAEPAPDDDASPLEKTALAGMVLRRSG